MSAPVKAPIGTRYRKPGDWAAGFHTGVDFPVRVGADVVAPVDSVIRFAGTGRGGWGAAYGIHVIGETVIGGKTYRWMTAHMSDVDVKAGDIVAAGKHIGESGNTGNSTGPHVHLEVREAPYGYYDHVDPAIVLNAGPVDRMDPANYGPGHVGAHITWLGQRLVAHGFGKHYKSGPGPVWGAADKANVTDFQKAQGWKGSAADGVPGPTTLRLLAADPKAKPRIPAKVLNLAGFKVTLPTGTKGKPKEVKQPALASFVEPRYFYVDVDGGVVFRAPVNGVTTPNSNYPRSELRETDPDEWSTRSGTHTLTADLAIIHTPDEKPDVVALQIHNGDDDVLQVRLEGAHLFLESDGRNVGDLATNYRLGTRFQIQIKATEGGIRVTYNGTRVINVKATGSGWYFKAGCYTQSNLEHDNATAYGAVKFYDLDVEHAA